MGSEAGHEAEEGVCRTSRGLPRAVVDVKPEIQEIQDSSSGRQLHRGEATTRTTTDTTEHPGARALTGEPELNRYKD